MEEDLKIGDKAPGFCLPDQNGKETCLDDFRGKWVVLYFYPKDNTPGCTMEAISFSENLKGFEELDAVILGVSPDSIESHLKFAEKRSLTIILLSDQEHKVLKKYGVKMLGANLRAIKKAEERDLFKKTITDCGLEVPRSGYAHTWNEAKKIIEHVGFPAIIRPSYTLGGTGGNVAYNIDEYREYIDW